MARRLTTNQEIAGSIPASINASNFSMQSISKKVVANVLCGCEYIHFAFISAGCVAELSGTVDVLK
jgi:hypothetical protein